MKFYTASVLFLTATVALSGVDANKNKKNKGKKKFIGDCTALSDMTFTFESKWITTDSSVYAYPCSTGYVTNFAANTELLNGVRATIDARGKAMGIKANCANLCDIDNTSYKVVDGLDSDNAGKATGECPLTEGLKRPDLFCDPDSGFLVGVETLSWTRPSDPCACKPDDEPDYIAGCTECCGIVQFKTTKCLASPGPNPN